MSVAGVGDMAHRLNRKPKLLDPRPVSSWHSPRELPDPDDKPVPPIVKWRNAVLGPDGPRSPTTRALLLTLSHHMNESGGSCFPSQALLARETLLSRRTVIRHLNLADAEKWIERTLGMGYASGWKKYEYQATVPIFSVGDSKSPPRQRHKSAPVNHGDSESMAGDADSPGG